MKLIECYIENFGGLSGRKIAFSSGLNTLKAENGYGKTTLSVFIKAMLFGLDATKRMRLEENDRKHYTPWHGGRFGGSLTFETLGKTYRIERTFSPKASEDTFMLYDVATGKPSTAYSENIGEELFGIDADGFERTVFLSEANLSGKNENKTVSAKLSNLVGYEGDLSVMDEAVLLLDKQRKRYYKRGGGGEIGDIKQRIAVLTNEINSLEALKSEYDDGQKRLAVTSSELEAANRKKKELLEALRVAEEARLKSVYIRQYREMLSTAKKDEEAKSHLESFFGRRIPTQDEIDFAREKKREAQSLLASAKSSGGEFSPLREFFPDDLCDADYENAKQLADKRGNLEHQKTLVDFELSSLCNFEENKSELIENMQDTRQGVKKFKAFSVFSMIVGIPLIALGALLGYSVSSLFFALAIFGAVLSLTACITLFISLKSGVGNKAADDTLLRKNERKQSLLLQLDSVNREISELDGKLENFIGKFPIEKTVPISAAVDTVMRKRELYLALTENETFSAKRREEDLLRAKKCQAEADAFLSLFPTVSSRPFDEISAKLVEYTSLSRSLERTKKAIFDFSREHGIDEASLSEELDCKNIPSPDDPMLNERIDELVRSRALLERQCRVLSDQIDRIDDLTAEKNALIEKAEEYESRLDTIRKTMDYLVEAKDLLTAKYLSKTKAAFDKYISLVGNGNSEEFHMDTSFSVKKNERGLLKDAEAYSRGQRDLYALAARFALVESLYEDERPFVILDDPFAYFDDDTLARSKKTLKTLAKDRQIIYLTCSEARNI